MLPDGNARDVVELMARHAVPLPDGRVAVLTIRSCPGAKPIALAEWDNVVRTSTPTRWRARSCPTSATSSPCRSPSTRPRRPRGAGGAGGEERRAAKNGAAARRPRHRRARGRLMSDEEKNALGARLYPLIELSQPELAGKLTACSSR